MYYPAEEFQSSIHEHNMTSSQDDTGLLIMRCEWQALGHAAPMHDNGQARKAFELFLPDVARVTEEVERLLRVLAGEKSCLQIQDDLGLKHEDHFRDLPETSPGSGLIEISLSDKSRSGEQRYRLTATGTKFKRLSD